MSARSDSWYATLSEEQLWQLYAIANRGAKWFEVTKIAKEELGLEVNPSRSGYYRWLDWMRGQESERRLATARIAALEADDLAKTVGLKDETAIRAYKSLAAEISLKTGDPRKGGQFLRMAMDLTDRQLHAAEVELKTKDLARKEEELKIAQKKLEMLEEQERKIKDAVTAARTTGGLTEETLKKIEEAAGLL